MTDHTAAFDVALREVATCCTLCGRRFPSGSAYRWWIFEQDGLAIGTLLCVPCQRLEEGHAALCALMTKRYSQECIDAGDHAS